MTVVMVAGTASTSKKRLGLGTTPQATGVVSSPRTRSVSSQRGRSSRRGRVARQLQTPASGRSTDTQQPPASAAAAARVLADTSAFTGCSLFFIF